MTEMNATQQQLQCAKGYERVVCVCVCVWSECVCVCVCACVCVSVSVIVFSWRLYCVNLESLAITWRRLNWNDRKRNLSIHPSIHPSIHLDLSVCSSYIQPPNHQPLSSLSSPPSSLSLSLSLRPITNLFLGLCSNCLSELVFEGQMEALRLVFNVDPHSLRTPTPAFSPPHSFVCVFRLW